MKYPNKILIGDNWWKVKQINKSGGRFFYNTLVIEVDKKSKIKDSIFFHEIMELLTCEQRVRYDGTSDNQYKFFLGHDDFTRLCDMALAVIKNNKIF